MATERVSGARAPEVRRRLRETRGAESLRETVKKIEAADPALTVYPTDVRRYEGGDPERDPLPPVDYVEAFAKAFDVDPDYLLAKDVPDYSVDELREMWASLTARFEAQMPQDPRSSEELARDQLRDRVALMLLLGSSLPHSPNDNPFEQLPRDTLAWIQDDLQRLFWEAFSSRGLTENDLLERAFELGRSIPTPLRLPREGFLRYAEIPERVLERWWIHQSAALRELLRDNSEFVPEHWNLGRYGEGGYPVRWEDWMRRFDDGSEWSRNDVFDAIEKLQPLERDDGRPRPAVSGSAALRASLGSSPEEARNYAEVAHERLRQARERGQDDEVLHLQREADRARELANFLQNAPNGETYRDRARRFLELDPKIQELLDERLLEPPKPPVLGPRVVDAD